VQGANQLLEGKAIDETLANKAADVLLDKALILEHNGYKIPIARALIRQTLMQLKA
jgi:CO/xanthine dehydrogenase FAD-binding subunit